MDEQHAATLERNRAVLEDLVSGGDASRALKQKVVATIQDLKQGLLERETEVCLPLPPCLHAKGIACYCQ